jgi:hypothetical protein
MAQNALRSDFLGAMGESRFELLCREASLICNRSTQDLAGWDFIVEFLLPDREPLGSLDGRSVPLSCHVQVKTLWAQNHEFRMRLSSAERLAKEVKPTFIYVLKYDGLVFSEAFLIHITGASLEKILKRLRTEDAAGHKSRINRKFISFGTSPDGQRIELTGSTLKGALEEAIGNNLADYVRNKSAQLSKAGFGPLTHRCSITFRGIRNVDEAVEVFLGLRRNVEVSNFQAYEVRFGIPLPLPLSASDLRFANIDPYPLDTCTITIRHKELELPAMFSGELFVPPIPNLPIYARKLLVKSQLFKLIIASDERFSFEFHNDLVMQKLPIETWVNLTRFLRALSLGGAKIAIRNGRGSNSLEFTIDQEADILGRERLEAWQDLWERAEYLVKMAGLSTGLSVSIQEIEKQAPGICRVHTLFTDNSGKLSFSAQWPQGVPVNGLVRAVFAGRFEIGNLLIGYYVTADMVAEVMIERVRWTSVRIVPGEAQPLDGIADFVEFAKAAGAEAHADMIIMDQLDKASASTFG